MVLKRPGGEASIGPQLPSLGGGGRKRNTLANTLSKGTGTTNPGGLAALPSLSPEQTANYFSQLGNLYSQYQLQKVGLRQQRIGLRAGFQREKAGIRSELISGLAGTENAAIERGVAGSSADLQARADVRGAAAAAKAEARGTMLEGLAQTRLAEQQAGIEFQMGAADLEASKLAAQQSLLAQQLQQNLIISGQEAQLDVLKQIYEAQVAQYAGGRRRGGGLAGGVGGGIATGVGAVTGGINAAARQVRRGT